MAPTASRARKRRAVHRDALELQRYGGCLVVVAVGSGCSCKLRRRARAVLLQALIIGLCERRALRADRPRLHARLRHHRADQLRPRRPVHARHGAVAASSSTDRARHSPTSPNWLAGCVRRHARGRWRSARSINVTIESLAYRRLRSAPKLAPLITAVGVSASSSRTSASCSTARRRNAAAQRAARAAASRSAAFSIRWTYLIVLAVTIPLLLLDDLDRAEDPAGQGDARHRAGPGRGPADGHQRQPDDRLHVRPRRRAGRRGRRSCTCRRTARRATTPASSSA